MNDKSEKKERYRTITDRMISGINSARYALSEPLLLKIARIRFAHLYEIRGENPLISVYVPTYNRASILMERAVKTVLDQTYKNFEFIIVADRCADNTVDLVSKIEDNRIRLYSMPDRRNLYPDTPECHWFAGPVIAANQALSMVRGKWIARLDDDDIWTPDHLEVLLNFAEAHNYEFVSAAYMAERNGKEIIVDVKDETPRIGGTQTWLYRSYLSFFKYNIHCWRKAWNKVNDTDIQQRFFDSGVKMGFLDQVVTHIIPRPGEKTVGLDAYLEAEKEGFQVHS